MGESDLLIAVLGVLLVALMTLLGFIGRCLIKKIDKLDVSFQLNAGELNEMKKRQCLQIVVLSAAFPRFSEMWDRAVREGNPLPTIKTLEIELGVDLR